MAVGVNAPYPQLSGTVVPNKLWSKKLIAKFYNATVFGEIASTDYEGEIKNMGDSVTIRTTPNITIFSYTKGMTLPSETPQPSTVDLVIDQANGFNFTVDDVDRYQSDYDFVDDWTGDASMQMRNVIDSEMLTYIPTLVAAGNQGATAGAKSGAFNMGTTGAGVALTSANIIDYIVDLGSVFDEANIPDDGRSLVLPAWAVGLIKKSAIQTASIQGGDQSMYRNGRIGIVDRFTIFSSNNVSTVADPNGGGVGVAETCYNILACHKSGVTFASQLTKTENLRSTTSFGELFRGLQVYGRKVVKGDSLALLYAYRG